MPHTAPIKPRNPNSAVTLLEVMVALFLFATVVLGVLAAFLQSRKSTEASILNAAAVSVVYGVVEQMKMVNYKNQLPNLSSNPPTVTVRLNQDTNVELKVVYTPTGGTLKAPRTTPAPEATAASLGIDSDRDNVLPILQLSTLAGSKSQSLSLRLWVWIDEFQNLENDVGQTKRVTIVYTYHFNDGTTVRTVRDREVFVRTF